MPALWALTEGSSVQDNVPHPVSVGQGLGSPPFPRGRLLPLTPAMPHSKEHLATVFHKEESHLGQVGGYIIREERREDSTSRP